MPKRFRIELTPEQRHELERVRDTDSRSYMRERAAAILKMADGMAARQVAQHGLLKRRDKNTVCEWARRYLATGLTGLHIRPGRGRKAAFFPSARNARGRRHPTAGNCAAFAPTVWSEAEPLVARGPAPGGALAQGPLPARCPQDSASA